MVHTVMDPVRSAPPSSMGTVAQLVGNEVLQWAFSQTYPMQGHSYKHVGDLCCQGTFSDLYCTV